jgi:hypothetical protein
MGNAPVVQKRNQVLRCASSIQVSSSMVVATSQAPPRKDNLRSGLHKWNRGGAANFTGRTGHHSNLSFHNIRLPGD